MTQPTDESAARFVEYRRTGARELRDEIVTEHLGLAYALARRYVRRGEPLEDLEQVATLGLLKAVERYEPDRGSAFSSFAAPTIIGELKRHFRDHGWAVRVPRALQESALAYSKVVGDLTSELGRSPRIEEVAATMGTDTDSVLEAMEANRAFSAHSVDAPAGEGGLTLADSIGEFDPAMAALEHELVANDLLASLPDRERVIVQLRFFDGLTQSEIAARVGVSQMHVSRLLARALETLRVRLGDEP